MTPAPAPGNADPTGSHQPKSNPPAPGNPSNPGNPGSGKGSERKKGTGGYPEGQPGNKPPQQRPEPDSPRPKTTPTEDGN